MQTQPVIFEVAAWVIVVTVLGASYALRLAAVLAVLVWATTG